MIGLALSGGGSRAMAFHLGCLRALNDLGVLPEIQVISTISGGSVIGAHYAYTPHLSFDEFENEVRRHLRSGFHQKIARELLNPHHLVELLSSAFTTHAQDAYRLGLHCQSLIHNLRNRDKSEDTEIRRHLQEEPRFIRAQSRTDAFERVLRTEVFHETLMTSKRRNDLQIVIGACELRTGTSFRFGNEKSGNGRLGELVDIPITVSLAVAASAAYPIFLPALDRVLPFRKNGTQQHFRVSLTDGGVYDNLGIQVLEPDRSPQHTVHSFACDYLVVCNAGIGQEAGLTVPLGFASRVKRSFEVVHRRVQDNAMHHLHGLQDAGKIRGFAMPYLGMSDEALPWKPSGLITRRDVIRYPTDFAAVSEEWIDKLSTRGEQLTRVLASHYLSELLG